MHSVHFGLIGGLSAAALFAAPVHAAQSDAAASYPSKPIRIVVHDEHAA
jgi:hypothetical protein